MQPTSFIHSFPRPQKDESEVQVQQRALKILTLIKELGFVMAPEVVEWNSEMMGLNKKPLQILQRRVCFTEINASELKEHSKQFGPIALSFDKTVLRDVGAMPVIYSPQGTGGPLSELATFAVKAASATKHVMSQFQELKVSSDATTVQSKLQGTPIDPDYLLELTNTNSQGKVDAIFKIKAADAKGLLQYVGYNNIPFDHSIGMFNIFLNMFYPTDNLHNNESLGYYRLREWRIIAGDLNINGKPLGRTLTPEEIKKVIAVDPTFWNKSVKVDGKTQQRKELALIYQPTTENWNPLDHIEAIYAPSTIHDQIRAIVGGAIPIHTPA
ncbi:abortive infection system antitoxin AbiGi family protein [Methylophilus medardicus]|uniref:Uncharacterized protein n=1 Tax=Methylophilus medardicus TaxID=2588534 RepID=A0A5B8CTY0_9PROT|nr:abortive infection system antitoxin AbiGi family protein [Methylophilus medardicus]QDC44767.1 hypothetical protein FIU01_09705 [Methylophilus medardicus]QDC49774.1 hypothetical protein FIU00_09705 [Methylophilus medardicus]QDC53479.1 hypothetical protein FIT99_09705 [Methylophilus medardicus]